MKSTRTTAAPAATSRSSAVSALAPAVQGLAAAGWHGPLTLTLPWPPSVNGQWRTVSGRAILSRRSRSYAREALVAMHIQGLPPRAFLPGQRLRCTFKAAPPDRRRRDLDNVLKPVLDLLCKAGILTDDC